MLIIFLLIIGALVILIGLLADEPLLAGAGVGICIICVIIPFLPPLIA
jgi:hypothetical protein